MPTWPGLQMMSPGLASLRETIVPAFFCAPVVRGSEMPSLPYTYCVKPEQSKPLGEEPPERYGTPTYRAAISSTLLPLTACGTLPPSFAGVSVRGALSREVGVSVRTGGGGGGATSSLTTLTLGMSKDDSVAASTVTCGAGASAVSAPAARPAVSTAGSADSSVGAACAGETPIMPTTIPEVAAATPA